VAIDEHVRATLRSVWQLAAETCVPIDETSDSDWSVTIDGERYTVRITPESRRPELIASLVAAEALAVSGISVGRPVRTVDGAMTATTSVGDMTLVYAVPGRALDADDPLDQQWWGDVLGRAHGVLIAHQPTVPRRLPLPEVVGAHLTVAAWLRQAMSEVAATVARLLVTDQLTYGVLHGDPRASEFRLDPATGKTGLTGWGVPPRIGPLVYDVAVAARDAGGIAAAEGFIDGYVSAGPPTLDEVQVALPVMLRLHWAHVAEEHARALAATAPAVPLPRAEAVAVAARRDALEEARQVLTALAEADRAE
jgi:Ser/Thr protein kinase RdoA (MazF antagonist)